MWLSTDPLSGYNPVMETEHYIDGQHNGGVYNSGNLNAYGYTYQNPIRYIDPNGKQSKFLEYLNQPGTALSEIRKYRNEIIQTSEKYGIAKEKIASIIFQEKTAGIRGGLANIYAKKH